MNRTAEAPLDPAAAAVLAKARRVQEEVRAGEAVILDEAVTWAALHEVDDPDSSEVATWGDTPVPLAGEGAPLVNEYCIADFAAALGLKTEAGRHLVAHAVELAHRLPHLYARVMVGAVPVWRARRIAEQTLVLSAEAAAYVDAEISPAADKIGPVVTQRLVDEAISRFMPDHARALAEQAAEQRHVTLDHRGPGFTGTSRIYGELDLADARALDDALARGAAFLKEQGSDAPLEVRRAQALGRLARGESEHAEVVINVHLRPDQPHAEVEQAGTTLVSVEQVQGWCRESTTVTIRPVIDLNTARSCPGYRPSPSVRDQVVLRDRTCRFPHCTRPARACDLDHIERFDPDGPAGQTNTDALASLCRHHHRLKTHGGWSYYRVAPDAYHWRSPYGYEFLVDADGTRDLTPRPVEPPGRARSIGQ
jgi:hypothetical protein